MSNKLALALLGVGIFAFLAVSTATRSSRGAVYLKPAVQHIGPVNPDDQPEVSAKFLLHNESGRPLMITQTHASCTCTDFVISSNTVDNGQFAEITMTIDTSGMRGRRDISAQILTDHPEFPHFEVTATVDIRSGNGTSEVSINVPAVNSGESLHYEFDVPGVLLQSLSTTSVLESIDVSLHQAVNDDGDISRLVFDGQAPTTAGLHKATLSATVYGRTAHTNIYVFLDVVSRFEVFPAGISFGLLRLGHSASEVLRITGRPEDQLRNVRLTSGIETIRIRDSSIQGNQAIVTLELNPTKDDEFIRHNLELTVVLEDGEVATVQVPVAARVVDAR